MPALLAFAIYNKDIQGPDVTEAIPPQPAWTPLWHANTHRTRIVDYAIVLDGEIDMLMDDTEVHMKAGDVLVQQGTNHARSITAASRAVSPSS